MNHHRIAGLIAAVLGLCALIAFLNAGMNTAVLSWPLEAYLGVVFTIGWLTRMPVFLVYLTAILIFILMTVALYKLGSWVYACIIKVK